jgi:type 1 glutamine amidotransferase
MNTFLRKFVVGVCLTGLAGAAFAISEKELDKITEASPNKATVKPKQPRKVLVFTLCQGFKHSSIPYCTKAMQVIGGKTRAFTCDVSDDKNVFTTDNLKQYDAIIFNNTTRLTFDKPQRKAIMQFVKGGKGIVGIHAATDNFYKWPEAAEMMGGTFAGHPWTWNGGEWAFKIEDDKSPITAAFKGKDFRISDEIYRTRQIDLRKNARVLIGLDMTDELNLKAEGVTKDDIDIPISWIRDFGKGRLFYCAFGHNHPIYWTPTILKHYLDGIQFAIGDLEADTTPIPFKKTNAD